MSRWTRLGVITDTCDREVTVFRHDAGDVRLIGQEDALEFEPAQRDRLRELLDRAAMPGQPGGEPPAGKAGYSRPCCDHCNNLEGDPDGHDYGNETVHDGPCAACAEEAAWAAEVAGHGG